MNKALFIIVVLLSCSYKHKTYKTGDKIVITKEYLTSSGHQFCILNLKELKNIQLINEYDETTFFQKINKLSISNSRINHSFEFKAIKVGIDTIKINLCFTSDPETPDCSYFNTKNIPAYFEYIIEVK